MPKIKDKVNRHFLLIDDDSDDLELLSDVLLKLDTSIVCHNCYNGEEALKQLTDCTIPIPEMIICDIHMPRINGHQFLLRLKNIPSLLHIPVIMHSTSYDVNEVQQLLFEGATSIIKKSITANELRGKFILLISKENITGITPESAMPVVD